MAEPNRLALSRGAGSKADLKPKFVAIYESLFKGEDPGISRPEFWDELFLLKINHSSLENCLNIPEADLLKAKANVQIIFQKCIETLNDGNQLRISHVLETMTILLEVLSKKKLNSKEILNLIAEPNNVETIFRSLTANIAQILSAAGDKAGAQKERAIKLYLTILIGQDQFHENSLIEQLVQHEIFSAFLQVFKQTFTQTLAFDAIMTMTLLANYKKHDVNNAYYRGLKELNNEELFKTIAQVLTVQGNELIKDLEQVQVAKQSPGMFSRFTGYLTSFVSPRKGEDGVDEKHKIGGYLLAVYELLYLNNNFMQSIFHETEAPFRMPPKAASQPTITPPTTTTTTDSDLIISTTVESMGNVTITDNNNNTNTQNNEQSSTEPKSLGSQSMGSGPMQPSTPRRIPIVPSLLVSYLKLAAIIFSSAKDTRNLQHTKSVLLTLLVLVEDTEVCRLIHDEKLVAVVAFIKINTQSKKKTINMEKRTLANAIVDLVIQFVRLNGGRTFNSDLLGRGLDIIHRMLCYEKKFRVRMDVKWKSLWNLLLIFMKSIVPKELASGHTESLVMCAKMVIILNMFITFGDILLPNSVDYDDLYYEMIRCRGDLLKFYEAVEQHDPTKVVLPTMANIKTIVDHFSNKIEHWTVNNPDKIMSPQQVMQLIKSNYENLKLRLEDNLDKYEPYSEHPQEDPYFALFVRSICHDLRDPKQTSLMSF
eukprot:TRINITY_DN9734_c0_g1_i1.p1 TRINITY_DN9734_c0_g1~~TRINITY_DN9734_c0_g1_i1.p1  ORF type:complete len:709 (-),score=152.98 TRINITY_DN9734_c0_g1_i1:40-2166(-)